MSDESVTPPHPKGPTMTATTGAAPSTPARECRHDSMRRDGRLDTHCLLCGADGYWHQGHRHDDEHPSGRVLFSLWCPDSDPETVSAGSDEEAK